MSQAAVASKSSGSPSKVTTLAAWKKRAEHLVQLPTGVYVKLRIPDLSDLAKADGLPQELRAVVMAELAEPGSAMRTLTDQIFEAEKTGNTDERDRIQKVIEQANELPKQLILRGLVEPKLTEEDLSDPDFPQEDLQFLAEIVQRQRAVDAGGRALGVVPLSVYESFRQSHGCEQRESGGEICPDCQRGLESISTDGGGVL